jgi:stearoyl-CoA desaturase (delta-9 desaturase)
MCPPNARPITESHSSMHEPLTQAHPPLDMSPVHRQVVAEPVRRLGPLTVLANLLAVVVPPAAFVAGMVWLWGGGFGGVHLVILLGGYVLTAIGITVGYHRLFTHRSFEAPAPVRVTLAILGSMAVEGPLFKWVGTHRRHHQVSDHDGDPHSPHGHGRGMLGVLAGLWHAHVGWIFSPDPPELNRYVGDLRRDRALRVINALFPAWVAAGLLIPALLGGLLTKSWSGALLGFLWGGLGRVFLVHHVTWSINSVCHVWGGRPFRTGDESRNNLLFGVLGLGEGWHNNHHAFPTSARHGLRWWQIDASYYLIKAMSWVGLARKIRVPAPAAEAAKRTPA